MLSDIKNDKDRIFKENEKSYEFVTKVNYPNNQNLVNQRITIDKEFNITEIKIFDSNDSIKMELDIDKIDYSPTFNDDYFTIDFIMESFSELDVFDEISLVDESIYPLFLPEGTKLANSEKLKLDNGERIIMTFDGDKPFLLVEETSNVMDEFTVIPTSGEPYMLMDTLGVMTSNSLSWSTGGVDFYLVSDVLNTDELVEIAQSISAMPTMK